MDEILEKIVGDIKQKHPEFYEKNKSIINIVENYPELTIHYKEIFKRVMLFIEELEELEIAQMSEEEQVKIRQEKAMHPLADKSFDEYVDLLWFFTKGFQNAQDQINKEKEEKL